MGREGDTGCQHGTNAKISARSQFDGTDQKELDFAHDPASGNLASARPILQAIPKRASKGTNMTTKTNVYSFPSSRVLRETRKRGQAQRVAHSLGYSSDKTVYKWQADSDRPQAKYGTGTGRPSPFEHGLSHILAEDKESHATGSGMLFYIALRIRQQRRGRGFAFTTTQALMFLFRATSRAALVCCSDSATQQQKEQKAFAACVAMMEFFQSVLAGGDEPAQAQQEGLKVAA